jgi:hypothetical protein
MYITKSLAVRADEKLAAPTPSRLRKAASPASKRNGEQLAAIGASAGGGPTRHLSKYVSARISLIVPKRGFG